jgi:hypothetical protein
MKEHVKYKIQPQKDGSFVILMKDVHSGRLTIRSSHDTYEDARDELTDMDNKPTQAEIMAFFKDMKDSIDRM